MANTQLSIFQVSIHLPHCHQSYCSFPVALLDQVLPNDYVHKVSKMLLKAIQTDIAGDGQSFTNSWPIPKKNFLYVYFKVRS